MSLRVVTAGNLIPHVCILVLFVLSLNGCAGRKGARATARRITYAPSLSYLSTKDDVQPAMRQMASAVNQLDRALNQPDIGIGEEARILAWLNDIQTSAESLQRPGKTNHPKLDEHLDKFLSYIDVSRSAVLTNPPNYYLVGNLTGACMYCHSRQ